VNGLAVLTLEAIQDAVRRRLAYVVAGVCVLSVLVLDSCTALLPSTLQVNGELVDVGSGVANGAGLVTFVVLGMWVVTLAGVLAADQLRETLEDGSATLALARPVSRRTFALARLFGVLVFAWGAGAFLLGSAALMLSERHDVSMAPAVGAAVATTLGGLALAAWSMAASLVMARIATTLLVFSLVAVVVLANAVGAAVDLDGFFGAVNDFGPPFASAVIVSLVSWLPEAAAEGLRIDAGEVWVRLLAWTVAGLAVLGLAIRRVELGR
jgi:ABC-type transport system involved in multi-copper enzyme maturation permease subunit